MNHVEYENIEVGKPYLFYYSHSYKELFFGMCLGVDEEEQNFPVLFKIIKTYELGVNTNNDKFVIRTPDYKDNEKTWLNKCGEFFELTNDEYLLILAEQI